MINIINKYIDIVNYCYNENDINNQFEYADKITQMIEYHNIGMFNDFMEYFTQNKKTNKNDFIKVYNYDFEDSEMYNKEEFDIFYDMFENYYDVIDMFDDFEDMVETIIFNFIAQYIKTIKKAYKQF